jgi:uncharacterized protein YbjT (DUF2867 family)
MHFLLTWGIGGTREQQVVVLNSLNAAIKPYQHFLALASTYVIRVNSQADWETIKGALEAIAKTSPVPLNFIMTPLMQGGRYDGWMPQPAWQQINILTQ